MAGLEGRQALSDLAEFSANQSEALGELEALVHGESVASDSRRVENPYRLHVQGLLDGLRAEAGFVGLPEFEAVYRELMELLEWGGAGSRRELVLEACDWLTAELERVQRGEAARDALGGAANLLSRLRQCSEESLERVEYDPEIVELFLEFQEESFEGLLEVDELLLAAERGRLQASDIDAIFRTFHTIKGVAGFVQQGEVMKLAHAAETVLDCVRQGRYELAGPALQLIFEVTAVVRDLISESRAAMDEARAPREDARVGPLRQRLITAATGGPFELPVAPRREPAPVKAPEKKREARASVKLDLERVDHVVELIGQLVVAEAHVSSVPERPRALQGPLCRLHELVAELGRERAGLRKVSLKPTFQKAARLVRDLARQTGKKVEIVLHGEDLQVDRSVVEQLGAPLIHMVRNAVDHGLESPEARLGLGKSETGLLCLRAFEVEGRVVVELSDDGRGLNRERILARARDRKLVQEGEVLEDREVFQLIFAPGFSTADKVTDLSGRGVGMDVVRRAVEGLGGAIDISSQPGQGSSFRMELPVHTSCLKSQEMDVLGVAC